MVYGTSQNEYKKPLQNQINSNDNIDDILDRAATQNISPNELNVLVTKTRELSHIREQELRHLQALLAELEEQLEPQH